MALIQTYQPYQRRAVPPELAQLIAWLSIETGNIQRSMGMLAAKTAISAKDDYGVVPDGTTNNTKQLNQAISDSNGVYPIILPAGVILFDTIVNATGRPLQLFGMGTGDFVGSVLQQTATAQNALALSSTASSSYHDLRDFVVNCNGTSTGGLALGTAAYTVSFSRFNNLRIINSTGLNAAGMRLNQCQEIDAQNVKLDGNYNNIYRPNLGSITTVSFHGPFSHCGGATNVGCLIEGPIFDLSFKNKFPFESNANEAIKSITSQAVVWLDDIYSEGNNTVGGAAAFNFSGPNAGAAADVRLVASNFHQSGSLTAAHLRLDYARARVEQNVGILSTDALGANTLGLATTANAWAHFVDNARGTDVIPIYQALPGTISWDEFGTDGIRSIGGKSGGIRFQGSTPASATATGKPGTITWDGTYVYVCIAANSWRRVAHAAW